MSPSPTTVFPQKVSFTAHTFLFIIPLVVFVFNNIHYQRIEITLLLQQIFLCPLWYKRRLFLHKQMSLIFTHLKNRSPRGGEGSSILFSPFIKIAILFFTSPLAPTIIRGPIGNALTTLFFNKPQGKLTGYIFKIHFG